MWHRMARPCANMCGWTAYSTFRTCCTKCSGASGPHARDCHRKNKRLAPAYTPVKKRANNTQQTLIMAARAVVHCPACTFINPVLATSCSVCNSALALAGGAGARGSAGSHSIAAAAAFGNDDTVFDAETESDDDDNGSTGRVAAAVIPLASPTPKKGATVSTKLRQSTLPFGKPAASTAVSVTRKGKKPKRQQPQASMPAPLLRDIGIGVSGRTLTSVAGCSTGTGRLSPPQQPVKRQRTTLAVLPPPSAVMDGGNSHVADVLAELSMIYKCVGDLNRALSYSKAANAIRRSDTIISSGTAAKALSGIGPSIASKVQTILDTGSLPKLDELRTEHAAIIELCEVHGVGPDTASQWAQAGIKSLADLRARFASGTVKLSTAQQIGLTLYVQLYPSCPSLLGQSTFNHYRYSPYYLEHSPSIIAPRHFYSTSQHRNPLSAARAAGTLPRRLDELKLQIPRDEVSRIGSQVAAVAAALDPRHQVTVCGSYRRGAATSGDIDIQLTHPNYTSASTMADNPLPPVIKALTQDGIVTDVLSGGGGQKFQGVCRLGSGMPHRRIDIISTPADQYGCALMYFTGSKNFNQLVRLHAHERGYKLNEHTLTELASGSVIPTPTEADVFDSLGLKYYPPDEREFGK